VGEWAEVHGVYTVENGLGLDALFNESEVDHLGRLSILLGRVLVTFVLPDLLVEAVFLKDVHAFSSIINDSATLFDDRSFHVVNDVLSLVLVALPTNAERLALQYILLDPVACSLAVLCHSRLSVVSNAIHLRNSWLVEVCWKEHLLHEALSQPLEAYCLNVEHAL
jgi:hypothetical protein